jgi:predicted phosphodiesterase
MAARWIKRTGAVLCVAAVVAVAVVRNTPVGAGPRPDLKPIAHWVFDLEGVVGGKVVVDRCGRLNATLLGSPTLVESGPTPRLELAHPDDGVLVRAKVKPDAAFLPREAVSVVAWVRIDETTEWGGILGCFQDNGPKEAGFILGYNKTGFTFGLAAKSSATGSDGFGTITYLTGKTEARKGVWYHVAAVYDGKQMRLYVNGQLDGTSDAQSGPILYAPSAPMVIGRYRDDDEDFPLFGAIREVMLCDHAVSTEQIAAHFEADRVLAEAGQDPPAGPQFVVEPYLQYATRTTMTVMWETNAPCTAAVEFGTTFPPRQAAKAEKLDTMGEVVLSGLEPNTKYFYRVVCTDAEGHQLPGKPLTFMTAVGLTDAFSFTVIGDTQRNPTVTGKVAKLMWERRPNFVVHCGDVVDDGAAKWQWTGDLFKPCNELFSRVPVYPCIGNHEKNHAHYYKYFALPAPEYYYSFRYGNAEFFSLDTNTIRTASLKPGGEQYQWLAKALAASDAKWKFCYHHHPAYSSDADDYGDTAKGPTTAGDVRVRPLLELYEKYKVDVVFNGHIHLYERTWPIKGGKVDQKEGVVHITSGGGGGKLEDIGPTPTFFKQEGRVDFHYCYLTIHQGTLNFKAFDQEGRLFDHFTLRKE